jgi:hypothetical protein
MTEDEVSKPIADEMVQRKYRSRTIKRKERDKFEGFKEPDRDDDWVPEPPTY